MTPPDTPKNTIPKPLPRITPNTHYAEDGSPFTRFESVYFDGHPSLAKVIETNTRASAKPLRGGLMAIGDIS